jgi:hypothetical protein
LNSELRACQADALTPQPALFLINQVACCVLSESSHAALVFNETFHFNSTPKTNILETGLGVVLEITLGVAI